jgi:hypothetical protein
MRLFQASQESCNVGFFHFASFRVRATMRSLSGQSGHQMAGRTGWIGRE